MTLEISIPLFLILLIGLPHGASDVLVARRMFGSNYLKLALFLSSYSVISIIIALIWFFAPFVSLALFLLISVSHFGLMDTEKSKIFRFRSARAVLYGATPIIIPVTFHTTDVNELFSLLLFTEDHTFADCITMLFPAWLLGCTAVFVGGGKQLKHEVVGILFLAATLAYLPTLWGFTLYFCLIHSLRHTSRLVKSLGNLNNNDYLSLVFIIFISIFVILMAAYALTTSTFDIGIIRATFIGLAALTVPHILLIDVYNGLARMKSS
jgi:Brp/Blh family beta-carotene 15,15'-monooxygenase